MLFLTSIFFMEKALAGGLARPKSLFPWFGEAGDALWGGTHREKKCSPPKRARKQPVLRLFCLERPLPPSPLPPPPPPPPGLTARAPSSCRAGVWAARGSREALSIVKGAACLAKVCRVGVLGPPCGSAAPRRAHLHASGRASWSIGAARLVGEGNARSTAAARAANGLLVPMPRRFEGPPPAPHGSPRPRARALCSTPVVARGQGGVDGGGIARRGGPCQRGGRNALSATLLRGGALFMVLRRPPRGRPPPGVRPARHRPHGAASS